MTANPPEVVVLSGRREVADDLCRALRRLRPRPRVTVSAAAAAEEARPEPAVAPARQAAEGSEPAPLLVVDLLAPGDRVEEWLAGFAGSARTVAVTEGRDAERLIEALASGYHDYLFYPVNAAELRLVWARHLGTGVARRLHVDVLERCLCVRCPSDVAYVEPAVTRMVETCRRLAGLNDEAAFRLRIALGEAVANAILHGNREDARRSVTIRAESVPGTLRVWVIDEGAGFDPAGVPDPRAPGHLARSTGRGLFLLRALMDEVEFSSRGNEVRLDLRSGETRRRAAGEAPRAPGEAGR